MKSIKLIKPLKLGFIMLTGMGTIGLSYVLLERGGYIFPIAMANEVTCQNCPQEAAYHQPPVIAGLINSDRNIIELLGDRIDKAQISILIEKSKYRLTIYRDKQPIKSYPIVLGENDRGDKLMQGDLKTPEGIFHLRDLYPHGEWSKFLWIDYPTATSWRKHLSAKQAGKIPWYKSIGSEVGIHGVPTNSDKLIENRINWTWGCISLKNADVDEIYGISRIGTLVEILP
jgi:hypothetical protein